VGLNYLSHIHKLLNIERYLIEIKFDVELDVVLVELLDKLYMSQFDLDLYDFQSDYIFH
jgi:hypothetical protein